MTLVRFASLSLVVSLAVSQLDLAEGCPFCTAVEPTLTQRREAAAVVALAELRESGEEGRTYRFVRITKGSDRLADRESLRLPADKSAKPGGLALLLLESAGEGGADQADADWAAIPLSEIAVPYVFKAPSLREPTRERLRYFAPFLEHADQLVAEDAWREFGHAPYDAVAEVVDLLPLAKMKTWLVDANIPQHRQGFYGLALGLARNDKERGENARFLRTCIERPANDFRAGFDGVLGGYLIAAGEPALKLIEERYLANPQSANGDVRHAMTALRFYHEYGHKIPPDRLAVALRHTLSRPEFAAAAIADLSRWEDWDSLPSVVELFGRPGYEAPATRRAIAAFVLRCPGPAAQKEAARLRELAPQVVAEAEQFLLDGATDQ